MSLPGRAMVARCKRRIKRNASIDGAQWRLEWANEQEHARTVFNLRQRAGVMVRLACGVAGGPVSSWLRPSELDWTPLDFDKVMGDE